MGNRELTNVPFSMLNSQSEESAAPFLWSFRYGFCLHIDFRRSSLSMLEFDIDVRDDTRTVVLLKIANHAPQRDTNHIAMVDAGTELSG